MPNYLLAYHGGKMADSQEGVAKVMAAWEKWMKTLGPALIVDLSLNFRRVVAIDADAVTVEPGVVLAELNAALARHGRRFAPDPASAATCTVGGMVATDASGGNAFRHGYTRDHVLGLEFATNSRSHTA